jgi:hypothetical protein
LTDFAWKFYRNILRLVFQLHYSTNSGWGESIIGLGGTQIFLPGCNFKTAQYAAQEIGRATVLSHTSRDPEENEHQEGALSSGAPMVLPFIIS